MKLFKKIFLIREIISVWNTLKELTGKYANILFLNIFVYLLFTCYNIVFQPYFIAKLFSAIESETLYGLYFTSAIGALTLIVFFVISYFNNVYLDLNNYKLILLACKNSLIELFKLPLDKVNESFKDGELVNRIDSGPPNMLSIILSIGTVLANIISAVFLFRLFADNSPILIIITTLLIVSAVVSSKLRIKINKKYELEQQEYQDKAGEALFDSVHEIAFASTFGCTSTLYGQYKENRKNCWRISWKQEKTSSIISLFTNLFSFFLKGLMSGAMFLLYGASRIEMSVVSSSYNTYEQLNSIVNSFTTPFVSINTQLVNVHRLNEVLSISTDVKLDQENLNDNLLIHTENIDYKLGESDILKNISIDIYKKDKIALIGRNGCGKSTLLRVLGGLYKDIDGKCTYNADMLDSIRNISYIPALSSLYNITIEDNVLMNGDGNVFRHLKMADLEFTDDKIPDTLASTLSGGQAQRVNIARGLINETSLLLADEPVSGLSVAQGKKVICNILDSAETAIVVTHNPEHLQYFNKIILMENGMVKAYGPIDEVSKHPAYKHWSGDIYNQIGQRGNNNE